MNKIIEIEFEYGVYADWKSFKRVVEAITKNKIKSISVYKVPRDNL